MESGIYSGIYLLVLLAISVLTLCNGAQQDDWPHPMYSPNRYSNKNSKPMSNLFTKGYGADLLSLTRKDLHHLKKVMARMPIKNTQLELLYELAIRAEQDEYFDISDVVTDPTETLIQRLIKDEALREQFTSYRSNIIVTDSQVLPRDEEVPEPEDRPQRQGVEACYADYDSYIGPETENMLYDITLRLCDDLFPLPCTPIRPTKQEYAHATMCKYLGLYQCIYCT